jgi:hypothetical protein
LYSPTSGERVLVIVVEAAAPALALDVALEVDVLVLLVLVLLVVVVADGGHGLFCVVRGVLVGQVRRAVHAALHRAHRALRYLDAAQRVYV